ncbi:SAM-dependent methyltransferase [Amycolatopsis antarctica]|uniref:SAM-dependent methyltransferase n=1 Tax=Amycolatopsis antarctica TaxID=1854586 RepID=A0A263D0A1_9PSEU|nr:N-6 DNA methylase [Amycolatopsis antarctica]OZM71558.1 SAM-dependent methyltransferase [Amycolatopsis antarctica]
MKHDATVNAGDIARLVDVGRAAVSNWRRRHADFPRPVGGTASSPLFSLAEIEEWLRRNGKPFTVSAADRLWQRLRATTGDLDLGPRVVQAGVQLLGGDVPGLPGERYGDGIADAEILALLAELAADRGPGPAFEFLCERYAEVHSRRLSATPRAVAELMAKVVGTPGTVLDPACGLGALPLATSAPRVLLQDADGVLLAIAALRLLLRGASTGHASVDSLRHNAFPDELADAVLCDPPFNERAWGYDELTTDARWEYGLPPRGEPELAWVQHCLSAVRPGGPVAILMPPAVAGRRAGRRIRGNLLRAGALRAIVTLADGGSDLWLLRRPVAGERPSSEILLDEAGPDLSTMERPLRAQLDGEPLGHTVRIIDVLDDDVDCTPARHRPRHAGRDLAREFSLARQRFDAITTRPPAFVVAEPRQRPGVTIAELVRAGSLTVRTAPARPAGESGDLPVLTAEDLVHGGRPTGRTADVPDLIRLDPGEVVASPLGPARVVGEGGAVLGPNLTAYAVDPAAIDPYFLAGCLRAAAPGARTASSRLDPRRIRLPRLSLAQQQLHGRAFAELLAFEDGAREAAATAETLVRLGFDGLVDGRLVPGD